MKIRAFIALSIDEPLVDILAAHADELRADDRNGEIRWVDPDNYHLTIEFLGEIEPSLVRPLGHELALALSRLELPAQRILEVSYFPFVARPRVVAALLRRSNELLEMHERVCRVVRKVGVGLQRRRFHPHITLGRVRARRAPRLRIAPVPLSLEADLSQLILYESQLGRAGAIYTPLFETPLPSVA